MIYKKTLNSLFEISCRVKWSKKTAFREETGTLNFISSCNIKSSNVKILHTFRNNLDTFQHNLDTFQQS